MATFWQNLLYGCNNPEPYPHARPEQMANRLAYFIANQPCKRSTDYGRATQFAIDATGAALQDAGLLASTEEMLIGISLGTGTGDSDVTESRRVAASDELSPLDLPYGVSGRVADRFGLAGPNLSISTACSAGSYAISMASEAIRNGWADVMVAGGTEGISRVVHACFNRMEALDPVACRPFDSHRSGTVYGEGAGILILESMEHALRRGHHRWYAEVLGSGWSSDAYHNTAPDPSGVQASVAIRKALDEANLDARELDCVLCHGTGTILNDRAESTGLHLALGEAANQIPACAIKSKLGHSGGAAGALASLAATLIIRDGLIPPTANLDQLDPYCPVLIRDGEPVSSKVNHVLINAYAFGGSNISLILGRV